MASKIKNFKHSNILYAQYFQLLKLFWLVLYTKIKLKPYWNLYYIIYVQKLKTNSAYACNNVEYGYRKHHLSYSYIIWYLVLFPSWNLACNVKCYVKRNFEVHLVYHASILLISCRRKWNIWCIVLFWLFSGSSEVLLPYSMGRIPTNVINIILFVRAYKAWYDIILKSTDTTNNIITWLQEYW